MILPHKKYWSHNRILLSFASNVQGHFPQVPHLCFTKVSHYDLISNGNPPIWGKVNERESKGSVMKLMVKKGEEVGGHLTS